MSEGLNLFRWILLDPLRSVAEELASKKRLGLFEATPGHSSARENGWGYLKPPPGILLHASRDMYFRQRQAHRIANASNANSSSTSSRARLKQALLAPLDARRCEVMHCQLAKMLPVYVFFDA